MGFLLSLLLTSQLAGITYLLLLFLITVGRTGIRWSALGQGVIAVWPLVLLTLCFHIFLGGGISANLANPPHIRVNYVNIQTAVIFTGRLILIVAVSVALFALYSPSRMAREIGRWLAVLPVGRKAAAQTELLIALALRFVPLMGTEYRRLQLALAARGEAATGRWARFGDWRPIMYPLMINAFRRADHVAVALQSRGYDPAVVRTNYSHRRMTAREWVSTLAVASLLAVAPWL